MNGQSYTWDNNGNLLSDGLLTYSYDQANRLKQVTQGATTYTFGYNGVGDRLSQTVGITTTRYVLDPGAGLTQVLADGTSTYLYGNDRLAQYQGAMQYFGADGLGSVRQIFDSSGRVIGGTRYDPYGNVMSQSGATSVFAFAGEQQDPTALAYLRARYYAAAQGRFTTRDVWEGDPNAPMSYNAWLYTSGNPVNLTDPTGQCDPDQCPSTYNEWNDALNLWLLALQNVNPAIAEAVGCTRWKKTETFAPPGAGVVFLTIDDGPGFQTRKVLDILTKYKVRATFFLVGQEMDRSSGEAALIAQDPLHHAIGIHTMTHPDWPSESWEDQRQEIVDSLAKIKQQTGASTALFRSPGGADTDEKVGLKKMGLYNYGWTVDSFDWKYPSAKPTAKDVATVRDNVLKDPLLRNGAIILIHSIHAVDPLALDQIIPELQNRKFTFGVLPRCGDPVGTSHPIFK